MVNLFKLKKYLNLIIFGKLEYFHSQLNFFFGTTIENINDRKKLTSIYRVHVLMIGIFFC
jgi:hypothetical protein